MTNPERCFDCRIGHFIETVRPVHEVELSHDNRKYAVRVDNYHVRVCDHCGLTQVDEDEEDRLSYALLVAAGLLQPEDIRAQREALGLKQSEMADALGVAVATLSRWETGGQIQQRVMDKILRAFFALPELRRFYGVAQQDGVAVSRQGNDAAQFWSDIQKFTDDISARWLSEKASQITFSERSSTQINMALHATSGAILHESRNLPGASTPTDEPPNRTPNQSLGMAA